MSSTDERRNGMTANRTCPTCNEHLHVFLTPNNRAIIWAHLKDAFELMRGVGRSVSR